MRRARRRRSRGDPFAVWVAGPEDPARGCAVRRDMINFPSLPCPRTRKSLRQRCPLQAPIFWASPSHPRCRGPGPPSPGAQSGTRRPSCASRPPQRGGTCSRRARAGGRRSSLRARAAARRQYRAGSRAASRCSPPSVSSRRFGWLDKSYISVDRVMNSSLLASANGERERMPAPPGAQRELYKSSRQGRAGSKEVGPAVLGSGKSTPACGSVSLRRRKKTARSCCSPRSQIGRAHV